MKTLFNDLCLLYLLPDGRSEMRACGVDDAGSLFVTPPSVNSLDGGGGQYS